MKRIIKVILFFWLLFNSSFVFAQNDLVAYLNNEKDRIAKVDSIETEINSFISNNLSNYSLSQSKIDEVTNNLLNEHDGSEDPITGSNLETALLDLKKMELRQLFFQTYPDKASALDPIPLSDELKQQCFNGGFENGVASYTFRYRSVNPPAHMESACENEYLPNPYTPLVPNFFSSTASLVTPGDEPLLLTLGLHINRVRSGNYSLKINPTPVTNSTDGQTGNITTVFRDFIINENQIDFSFLQIGSITYGDHGEPAFRYRLIDNVTHAVLRNVCIPMDYGDCRYAIAADVRAGWQGTMISYTPQWICQRINTDDLIGRNVRLEFTVADCEFRGHFCTVYIDNVCGVTCSPTWGNINLNPLNLSCPTSPFNVCGDFQLPANSSLTSIVLNVLNPAGTVIGTVNNPTITGNNFCFTVNPSVFGINPSGNYTFQAVANISSSCPIFSPIKDVGGVVSFNNCCQPILNTSATISTMVHQERSDWIKTTDRVTFGNNVLGDGVVYHAANYVELNPGFEAISGSQFKAYIQGCSNSYTYKNGDDVTDYVEVADNHENKAINLIKNKINIYPNPTNSYFTVNYANEKFNHIIITSLEGRVILNQKIEASNSYQLDISNYKDGIYTLSIQTNDGNTITDKLIKD